jgi:hypothetical protein
MAEVAQHASSLGASRRAMWLEDSTVFGVIDHTMHGLEKGSGNGAYHCWDANSSEQP